MLSGLIEWSVCPTITLHSVRLLNTTGMTNLMTFSVCCSVLGGRPKVMSSFHVRLQHKSQCAGSGMLWLEMANSERVSKHHLVTIEYTEEKSYLCQHYLHAISRTDILQSRQTAGLNVFISKLNILMLAGRALHSMVPVATSNIITWHMEVMCISYLYCVFPIFKFFHVGLHYKAEI